MFSEDDEVQLVTEVREVLAETGGESVTVAELRSLVDNTPVVARSILELDRRVRVANERADGLLGPLSDQQRLPPFSMRGPHEEVRDYLNGRHDHVEELDERAESIFRDAGLIVGDTAPRLATRLREKHGVQVVVTRAVEMGADKRRFDPGTRTLRLVDFLRPGQQAFQMAFQLALLEVPEILDALVREGKFSCEESRQLARIGLANYFAGARSATVVRKRPSQSAWGATYGMHTELFIRAGWTSPIRSSAPRSAWAARFANGVNVRSAHFRRFSTRSQSGWTEVDEVKLSREQRPGYDTGPAGNRTNVRAIL